MLGGFQQCHEKAMNLVQSEIDTVNEKNREIELQVPFIAFFFKIILVA